jgi:hypothetical protein
MSFPTEQIAELRALVPGVMACEEAAVTYFLLPGIQLPAGCKPSTVDALLCPTPRDGYESRLFFSQVVTSSTHRNWNVHNTRIVDRQWSAFSWKTNKPGLRLAQMVAEHLSALK